MKKTYINPEMEIIELRTQPLLAGSEKVGLGDGPVDPSSADGRGGLFADDEDWLPGILGL